MYYERLLKRSKKIYITVDEFLADVSLYFKWVDEHPLLEEQIFQNKGAIIRADKGRMRPYTKKGLASHLGMSEARLMGLRKRGEDWEEAMQIVDEAIFTQKFEGAASGLLNASIITRDLGLAEKQEVSGVSGGAPITFSIQPITSGTYLPSPEQELGEDETDQDQ